jgi:S-disulfanyl-L-cysteine oxidoreductase SoxD
MNPQLRSKRRPFLLIACGGLASVCIAVIGARAANSDGWYTPDQAAHGHITFNSYCAECHRPDLTGAIGPALIGKAFLKTWTNKPIGDLYDFEHSKMPANNPGSVPDDKIWDITAYILQKNGLPAGSTALTAQATSRTLVEASSGGQSGERPDSAHPQR